MRNAVGAPWGRSGKARLAVLACIGAMAGAAAADDEAGLRPPTAGETALGGFVARHFGGADRFVGTPGAGERSLPGYLFGTYRNGLDRDGYYAAREFRWRLKGRLNAGLVVGAATGDAQPLSPLVLPELVLAWRPVELALVAIPAIRGVTPAAAVVQARYRF